MLAWVQAGTSMAEKFDGFLGSGWVRPSEDSPDWHMLYRFADAEALAAWEASPAARVVARGGAGRRRGVAPRAAYGHRGLVRRAGARSSR